MWRIALVLACVGCSGIGSTPLDGGEIDAESDHALGGPLDAGGEAAPTDSGACLDAATACNDVVCGAVDNGCGLTFSCGCAPDYTCIQGTCSCTPDAGCPSGSNCGDIADDGCGHKVSCGAGCTGFDSCGGGGQPFICGCTPKTAQTLCVTGVTCGIFDDGCGSTVDCGTACGFTKKCSGNTCQ